MSRRQDILTKLREQVSRGELVVGAGAGAGLSANCAEAAGADILVPHLGLTTKGSIGAQTSVALEDAPALVQAMHDAAKEVNPEIIVLCHGGPIAEPDDVAYVLTRTDGIAGMILTTEALICDRPEKPGAGGGMPGGMGGMGGMDY